MASIRQLQHTPPKKNIVPVGGQTSPQDRALQEALARTDLDHKKLQVVQEEAKARQAQAEAAVTEAQAGSMLSQMQAQPQPEQGDGLVGPPPPQEPAGPPTLADTAQGPQGPQNPFGASEVSTPSPLAKIQGEGQPGPSDGTSEVSAGSVIQDPAVSSIVHGIFSDLKESIAQNRDILSKNSKSSALLQKQLDEIAKRKPEPLGFFEAVLAVLTGGLSLLPRRFDSAQRAMYTKSVLTMAEQVARSNKMAQDSIASSINAIRSLVGIQVDLANTPIKTIKAKGEEARKNIEASASLDLKKLSKVQELQKELFSKDLNFKKERAKAETYLKLKGVEQSQHRNVLEVFRSMETSRHNKAIESLQAATIVSKKVEPEDARQGRALALDDARRAIPQDEFVNPAQAEKDPDLKPKLVGQNFVMDALSTGFTNGLRDAEPTSAAKYRNTWISFFNGLPKDDKAKLPYIREAIASLNKVRASLTNGNVFKGAIQMEELGRLSKKAALAYDNQKRGIGRLLDHMGAELVKLESEFSTKARDVKNRTSSVAAIREAQRKSLPNTLRTFIANERRIQSSSLVNVGDTSSALKKIRSRYHVKKGVNLISLIKRSNRGSTHPSQFFAKLKKQHPEWFNK
jgi:hypothetical protein